MSDVRQATIRRRTSTVRRQASDVRRRTSSVRRKASDVRQTDVDVHPVTNHNELFFRNLGLMDEPQPLALPATRQRYDYVPDSL